MPPNGPDEWRARIGHWENRKLRWYQARYGSCPHVPLHHLLCVLLLLSLAGKVGTGVCEAGNGMLSSLGKFVSCCACDRHGKVGGTSLLSLFLALSLLLVVAGDVETNPGPIIGENCKSTVTIHDVLKMKIVQCRYIKRLKNFINVLEVFREDIPRAQFQCQHEVY